MKRLTIVLALLFIAGSAFADDGGLADRLFTLDKVKAALLDAGLTPTGSPSFSATTETEGGAEELNPGKALLLSAIIPGAGELYAGYKLRAALFFGIELAAWTGVIYFYNKGQDKDAEFRRFADDHFNEDDYREMEYFLATNAQDTGFSGLREDWEQLDWEEKIYFLPDSGFTHDLPLPEDRERSWSLKQQFYEMIGKYIHQFGFGWDDNFGDDDGLYTAYFDGRSPNSEYYMDMRHDSNQLLKTSTWGYNIVLLNHVASALHASFTVRMLKQRARAQVGFRQVEYNGRQVTVGGLDFRW